MARNAVVEAGRSRKSPLSIPGGDQILQALPTAVLLLDRDDRIRAVNSAAEQLFDAGASYLRTLGIVDLVAPDSPLTDLIALARRNDAGVSEFGVRLDTPRTGPRTVTIQVTPLIEEPGWLLISLHEHSIALRIGEQLVHRGAARTVTAIGALLAHEIKNPLSGIRGAAQLLQQAASEDDRVLTRLIQDETDRIVALLERMEIFSADGPVRRQSVNIHEVLEHVRRVAQAGFGRHVRFSELYDPSLPPVSGNRDALVHVFLNLVKNAVEAVPKDGGEIVLSTAYRHGVWVAQPGSDGRLHLPLAVSVADNGLGISQDIRANLFDPFVTSKPKGSGLGLALVAKVVNDHGGIVEFDSEPRRTVFRVLLPVAKDAGEEMA